MSVEMLAGQQQGLGYTEHDAAPPFMAAQETTSEMVAMRYATRFLGRVAMNEDVEDLAIREPIDSLRDAIQKAANGDQEARQLVKINAKTVGVEQTIKTGHIGKKVPLLLTPQGELYQHRQSLNSVHTNALKVSEDDPVMLPRAEAEARNKFRIEALYEQGYFEDYSLVVVSLAEDHPEFFTETMTTSIQVTGKDGAGLATEPAFVSGVTEPGGEQHDMETAINFFARFGIDVSGMTPAEIINTPVLIHNSLIPDGAVNIVEWWDDDAGGTWFGENKPRQNYLEYLDICAEREERFEPKAEMTTEQIIREYHLINTERGATQRLHELSQDQMVELAIGDTDIDPRVFGPAARYIERARLAYQRGEAEQLLSDMSTAKLTAETTSCPGAGVDPNGPNRKNKDKDTSEDCEFVSKKCPMCGAKNVKTKVTKNKITGSCGCSKSK